MSLLVDMPPFCSFYASAVSFTVTSFSFLSYSVATYFDASERYKKRKRKFEMTKTLKKIKKPKCCDLLDVHDGLSNFEQTKVGNAEPIDTNVDKSILKELNPTHHVL